MGAEGCQDCRDCSLSLPAPFQPSEGVRQTLGQTYKNKLIVNALVRKAEVSEEVGCDRNSQ